MRLGIFGGTFNPIHIGHIQLAKAFIEQVRLDALWFVVSPMNPFKKDDTLLADSMRLEMTHLSVLDAFSDNTNVKASDYEFHLPRPSYMINTLEGICRDNPHYEPILLIGEDNWKRFPLWYRSNDILAHYPIYVYPRQEDKSKQPLSDGKAMSVLTLQSMNELDCNPTTQQTTPKLISAPLYDISSTQIRSMVREGKDISSLVTPSVVEYINMHHLYKD